MLYYGHTVYIEGIPMRYTNTCDQCGKTFETPYQEQKYCNRRCWQASRPRQIHARTCPTCGKDFTTTDRRQVNCQPACKHAAQATLFRNRVMVPCAHCGKELAIKPSLATGPRYCNRACVAAAKQAAGTTQQTCTVCGVTFTRKNSRLGDFCSYACLGASKQQRITKACIECGASYETIPSHAHLSTCCSRACSQKRALRANLEKKGENRPERAVRAALDTLGMRYIAQHPVDQFVIDFYLIDDRIALEVDGVYWHSLPQVAKRDKRRTSYLAGRGIRVVRVTDAAITATDDLPALIRALVVQG